MSIIWTHHLENAPKRVNHASAAVDELIFSFGGYCTGEDYEAKKPIEVHCLNTNTLTWCQVRYTYHKNQEDIPFNRYGHTVVADGDTVYLWGGRNDDSACKVLFAFNCYKLIWSRPQVSGPIPLSRDGHSATIHNRKMFIFGGFEDETQRFSQDVHCLDLRTMTWSRILTTGDSPSWRDFHTLSAIGDYLIVFGGRSDLEGPFHTRQEYYDDSVHLLNLKTLTWTTRPAVAGDPIGRRSHSAFVFQKCLYIFGGFYGARTNVHYNDLFKFDLQRNQWSPVVTKGTCPCPRRRQSCAMIGSKLYLFGGTSPTELFNTNDPLINPDHRLNDQNDLFVLDFSPSLQTLSKLAIIKHRIDPSSLPLTIQTDIEVTGERQIVSREAASSG